MRWLVTIALLASCDRVFGLSAGGNAPDGSPSNDAAAGDAAPSGCDGTGYRQGNSAVASGNSAKRTLIGFSSQPCDHPLVVVAVSTRSPDMPTLTDTELGTYAVAGGGAAAGNEVWLFYRQLADAPDKSFHVEVDTTSPPAGTLATSVAILEYRSSMSVPFDAAFTNAAATGPEKCAPFSAAAGELVVAAQTYAATTTASVASPLMIREAPEADDTVGATLAVAENPSAPGGDASATFTTSTLVPWGCVIASFRQ